MTDQPKRRVAFIGSTGSIGRQALEVAQAHPDRFAVEALTAYANADLLIEQALRHCPAAVAIADERHYLRVKEALTPRGVEVYAGYQALVDLAQRDSVDVVVMALVGYAGLMPTIGALRAGKTIALANKEVLAVAGELVMQLARVHQAAIYPVDSEHSAIFQCLIGEPENAVEKIILTASGGPFRGKTSSDLAAVSPQQALQHPNWNMGKKITIDSATLMNKGLEVMEARWLFDISAERIEVVIHPQSIIHSMVQFCDGSIKAQLGRPDMRLPIQYAMTYPDRPPNPFDRIEFDRSLSFSFEKPDTKTFRNLALAFEALRLGGSMPCVLNAANEVAVSSFLEGQIGFMSIPQIVEQCMERSDFVSLPQVEDYAIIDRSARRSAMELARQLTR